MTLLEAIEKCIPGSIISFGNIKEGSLIEIFVTPNKGLRFSDDLMAIDNEELISDKWELK